ncbi:MAG: 8-oxoguanine DNA glycosylase [Armatimonadota bacterium]|nr:MAG: 8-oxoguanine DNA glycosylase [Armatimonadota bacterium]
MWRSLDVPPEELRCDVTLVCGQSFRWKPVAANEWRGVIGSYIVTLRQTADDVLYQSFPNDEIAPLLRDYFRLHIPLAPLYRQWCEADVRFAKVAPAFPGLRVLRIDPVECLFSFLCSSANNIPRITRMIDSLCQRYGKRLAAVDGVDYHRFPPVHTLAEAREEDLFALGFGYRARVVVQAARYLHERGRDWLYRLRYAPYEEAHHALTTLPGVGHKIADCVCLFALDKPQAIPVDTHVWQIARRDYLPELQGRSLTEKVYWQVGDFFRARFGAYAGWAHNVLFAAELPAFRTRLQPVSGTGMITSDG